MLWPSLYLSSTLPKVCTLSPVALSMSHSSHSSLCQAHCNSGMQRNPPYVWFLTCQLLSWFLTCQFLLWFLTCQLLSETFLDSPIQNNFSIILYLFPPPSALLFLILCVGVESYPCVFAICLSHLLECKL